MALIIRTLLITICMIVGAWLNVQINIYAGASGNLLFLASVAMYIVYFVIGIVLGTMFNPRLTKNSQKLIYLFPIVVFIIIGVTPLLSIVAPMLAINRYTQYLKLFTYLAWTIVGTFVALVFR